MLLVSVPIPYFKVPQQIFLIGLERARIFLKVTRVDKNPATLEMIMAQCPQPGTPKVLLTVSIYERVFLHRW